MMQKSETARVCGNCEYAEQRLNFREIKRSKKEAYLFLLRRHASSLKDAEVLCQKEHIIVSLTDVACAFWKPDASTDVAGKYVKLASTLREKPTRF